jgi:hypothetical protein
MPLDWQIPLAPFNQPPQSQGGTPAYDRSVTGQRLADDGYPDDWFVPGQNQAADGYPDDWYVPSQRSANDGHPDDWFVPGQKAANDGFPDDWFVPGQAPTNDFRPSSTPALPAASSAGNGEPSVGLPKIGSPWLPARTSSDPGTQPANWMAPRALTQPALSGLAVPVNDQAGTKPWWIPMGPGTGFEPWADQFIKGMQGLTNFLRSRQPPSRSNDADCEEEWDYARRKCEELLSQRDPPRWVTGRYRNAEDCARGLVSERCGGNPATR